MAISLEQRQDLVPLNWSHDGLSAVAPAGLGPDLGLDDYSIRKTWRGWQACRGTNATSVKMESAEEARAFVDRDFKRLILARAGKAAWLPMQISPHSGWAVLAKVRSDIAEITGDSRYQAWAGQQVVVQAAGFVRDDVPPSAPEGYGEDVAGRWTWDMAAPAGAAGMPEDWFEGWQPLADPLPAPGWTPEITLASAEVWPWQRPPLPCPG